MEPTRSDAEWEAILNTIEKRKEALAEPSRDAYNEIMLEMLPNQAERIEFAAWELFRPDPNELRPSIPLAAEYKNLIEGTDFRDDEQIQKLNRALNMSFKRYIPLGTFKGLMYRLETTSELLISDVPLVNKSTTLSDGSHLLPRGFLAVDPHILPMVNSTPYIRSSVHAVAPAGFAKSNETGVASDEGHHAFVFYQLGSLQFSSYSPDTITEFEQSQGAPQWTDTKFAAVVKLTPEGKRDGIYIFCRLVFRHTSGKRKQKRQKKTYRLDNLSWGFLPQNPDTRIYYAKIAERFEDLAEGKEFNLTHILQQPAELARAVRTPDGIFKRHPEATAVSQRLHSTAINGENYHKHDPKDNQEGEGPTDDSTKLQKRPEYSVLSMRKDDRSKGTLITPPSSKASTQHEKPHQGHDNAGVPSRSQESKDGEEDEGSPITPPSDEN
ncbi:hypothetical protein DM02DRAFT_674194 [Periconia macrospinosa]|uniref:Uncharacterized protein n=1 Tax=Periconia macrospinosa TaxID=97972 RepID=A0A2V1DGT4_9PLEO|nr:hypothetical protein DM02DRAFT_674194 [Periconia macrospinosa]